MHLRQEPTFAPPSRVRRKPSAAGSWQDKFGQPAEYCYTVFVVIEGPARSAPGAGSLLTGR